MQTQACQPCAKRKVRCDRKEPCSNCKRRTQDQCIYAEVSPTERIKQLEALVRSLGASSEHSTWYENSHEQAKPETTLATRQVQPPRRDTSGDAQPRGGTNPMIVKEDGESVYLESCVTLCRPLCIQLTVKIAVACLEQQGFRIYHNFEYE